MTDDLIEKARAVFVTDVDEETRAENLAELAAWEKALRENEAFAKWQEHDISRQLSQRAQEAYRDASMQLMTNRTLTDQDRARLYATQDACVFMIGLVQKDAKGAVEQVHKQIKHALALFHG